MKRNNSIFVLLGIAVLVVLAITFGLNATKNIGKTQTTIDMETAQTKLDKLMKNIEVSNEQAEKSPLDGTESATLGDELPEIDKYPFSVTGDGNINIEIFATSEKAGNGTDGWMNEVATSFNNEGFSVDGKTISVSVRPMASGLGMDYIVSKKYLPDAYAPSNSFWGDMIQANGGSIAVASDRLVGNVAGIVLKNDKYKELKAKYGTVDMKSITQAVSNDELLMGYTNPLASATGLNFLVSTLAVYDPDNILSEKAVAGFRTFQGKVPFVAYTTLQMRDSANKGSLDGFVLEYQSFYNSADLKGDYTFIPFGMRHDNPIYSVGALTNEKQQVLSKFIEYCKKDSAQALATKYGFNQMNDYQSALKAYNGSEVLSAQKLWKKNKDTGTPIMAVFIADMSGSMDGEPINSLKTSLLNSMKYINSNNYIGVVSFNSTVDINLPIAPFDINQQSYFKGAVENLSASGGTATYDGILVGLDMLQKAMKTNPNVKPMLFLLSDGQSNQGNSLKKIESILAAYKIPVYTIAYGEGADTQELQKVSAINEAASINTDVDDVIYKIKSLFDSNL